MAISKNYSVLVVDDDSLMREMLKAILRSADYQVVGEASNGEDAILLCARLKPKLVLLDIQMHKMDGMQALDAIRKSQPETKIIMVSAEPNMDQMHEAISKGAVGFVVKPFNATHVLDEILKCITGKERDG